MSLVPFTSGKYSNNEVLIFDYLKSKGYSTAIICGILANIEAESSFNTEAVGDSGTSYGLCQWHKGRRDNMISYCRSMGIAYNTVKGQLSYLLQEFSSGENRAYREITKASNDSQGAYNAGYAFCYYFERPSNKSSKSVERGNRARQFYAHYMNAPEGNVNMTSGATLPSGNSGVTDYDIGNLLPIRDVHSSQIAHNFTNLEEEDFEYGYLIDLNSSKSFRFYIPEFSERAGANWGDIDIPGRSVTVKYYNSTSSRVVTVELHLYAGVGVYAPNSTGEDVVGRMHDDLNFVKSLEYPDYSTALISPPPRVQISLGRSVNFIGVVSDVSVDHLKPLDSKRRAMYSKLSFTVTQVETNPPSIEDIRNGNYTIAHINSDALGG